MEVINDEIPKSPVNKGSKDSLIGKFKEARPKKPERRKMIMAQILEDFSKHIKKIETKIKIKGIILCA